ncbi:MAG: hypothetical protein HKN09_04565, partial [Saprospiraceae bacterium]|nr:hypothetical protein [Saprospiraceae bacterium]
MKEILITAKPWKKITKKNFLRSFLVFFIIGFANLVSGQADIILTTISGSDEDIFQGTQNNVVYILQMDVSTTTAHLDNFSMVTAGTYDSDDVNRFRIYRNSIPSFSGATYMGQDGTTTGSGETASIPTNYNFGIGTHYLLITAYLNNDATDGNTIHFDGGTNPAVLSFTTAPNFTDNQSDVAGTKTIQGSDISLTTISGPDEDIFQGTQNNVVYILQMDVSTTTAHLSNFSMVTAGTYDSDDVTQFRIYR